jgi:hypothetical protein
LACFAGALSLLRFAWIRAIRGPVSSSLRRGGFADDGAVGLAQDEEREAVNDVNLLGVERGVVEAAMQIG